MLIPPEGFGCVEDGIYRCSTLEPLNMPFLTTLRLSVIVSLNPARLPKASRIFAEENNIELVHLGIQPWRAVSEWEIVLKDLSQDALTYLLDKRNYPLLLVDATNAFVGTLRHLQHWSYTSILTEYRAFAGDHKTNYKSEVALELSDIRCISHEEAVKRRKSIDQQSNSQDKLNSLSDNNKRSQRTKPLILNLPPDDVLPDWFIRQQKMWEEETTQLLQQS